MLTSILDFMFPLYSYSLCLPISITGKLSNISMHMKWLIASILTLNGLLILWWEVRSLHQYRQTAKQLQDGHCWSAAGGSRPHQLEAKHQGLCNALYHPPLLLPQSVYLLLQSQQPLCQVLILSCFWIHVKIPTLLKSPSDLSCIWYWCDGEESCWALQLCFDPNPRASHHRGTPHPAAWTLALRTVWGQHCQPGVKEPAACLTCEERTGVSLEK